MKKILTFLFLLCFLTSCGDEKEINSEVEGRSPNLFSRADNQFVDKDLDSTIVGLWQSEVFEIDNINYQILWEVTDSDTTIALKCQIEAYQAKFVQVSAEFEDGLVRSLDRFTIRDFSLPAGLVVEDEAELLSRSVLGANRFPIVPDDDGTVSTQNPPSFSEINELEQLNNLISAQDDPENNPFDEGTEYYSEGLCFIRIEEGLVDSKGLLASGMDTWSIPDTENTNDGLIMLRIEDLENAIEVRKIQNR